MDRRLSEYLRQIRTAAQESIEFTHAMSAVAFETDTKTQRAVTMSLVILGEAAGKIETHFPEFVAAHPEIPWTAIRGMRNRIAHEYFNLDFETVWATLQTEIPELVRRVDAVLAN